MSGCANNIDINVNINDLFTNIKNKKKLNANHNAIQTVNQSTNQHVNFILQEIPVYMNTEETALYVRCTGCNSDKLSEIDGYNICDDCGLYNDCVIDSGQEWRYYGSEDTKGGDPARCDMTTNDLLPKTSFGSLIGFGSKETYTTKRIRNMNYWNKVPYRESSLLETFNNITIMAQNVGISQCIIEDAKYMYKKVSDLKSSRRTKKEGMKAGSIALACKKNGVPRNSNEIAKIFKQKNTKTFRKSIKTFEEIWNNIQIMEKCTKPCSRNDIQTNEHDLDSDVCDDSAADSDDNVESDSNIEKYNMECDSDTNDETKNDNDNTNIDNNIQHIQQTQQTQHIQHINNYKPSNISATEIIPIDEADFMSDDDNYSGNIYNNYTSTNKNNNNKNNNKNKNNNNNNNNNNKSNTNIENTTYIDNVSYNKTIDAKKESNTHKPKYTPQRDYDSVKYLHRFCSILGLDDRVYEICKNILIKIEIEKYLERHNPLSRTASVIYYVVEKLDLKLNKFSIVQTCEISDVTITKCYHKIAKYKNLFTEFFEMYD